MPLTLHSFLIMFIRKEGDEEDWDTVMLQRPRTHRTPFPLSFCIVEDWEPFTNHYSDRPLLKGMAYTGPFRDVEVVIKVAYAPVPGALRRLKHQANAYDKVASLHGFFVPECLGLFTSASTSSEQYAIGAALPTVYYGNTLMCEVETGARPADECWQDMDASTSTRRIIKSASALHRRGLRLGDIGPECIVLDDRLDGSDTDAFIIGLADAAPHKCRQTCTLVHGGLAPQRREFGCDELYYLCVSLQMWLPKYILCFAEVFETKLVYPFPWLLAAHAPSDAPRADAIKDALAAIIDYAERYTDDEGDELKGVLAEKRGQIIADFVAGKVPHGEEPYYGGIRSPLHPAPASSEHIVQH
ncbi:hypothetical protein EXIGLDRAFT_830903 [Exidia glandulosa HHB12029]|uniref:Protein kinase domain-containing protein n=1 Tax=Exidia glandulosa HHB12029 TaxID=1314781 RepID=A0A165N5Q5_EXIGL|nr:hypothetical protein EXIGLDRAFT_830903 [Exidia glandulosa HHB12029]